MLLRSIVDKNTRHIWFDLETTGFNIFYSDIIEIAAIMKLLVTAAKQTEIVTSAADKGAYKRSTIFPCILPIIKDEDE